MSKKRFLLGAGLSVCGLLLLMGNFHSVTHAQKNNPFSSDNKLDGNKNDGKPLNPFSKEFELAAQPKTPINPFTLTNKLPSETPNKVAQGSHLNPFAKKFELARTAEPSPQTKIETQPTELRVKETPEGSAFAKYITYDVKIDKQQVAPGEVITFTVTGNLPEPSFYTFPASKEHWIDDSVQAKTKFQFYLAENEDAVGQEAAAKEFATKAKIVLINEPEPKLKTVELVGEYFIYPKSPIVYQVKLRVLPETKPGAIPTALVIQSQVCDTIKGTCIGGRSHQHLFDIVVLDAEAQELSKELKSEIQARKETNVDTTDDTTKPAQMGILTLMGWAAAGAFLMLLTPCVFPMIPVTVNFFLKQSESHTYNGPLMASVYSGTIFSVLTVVIIFFLNIAIWLAADPWFNLVLGFILIVFAMSLFGLFELELPSFLMRFTAAREGQGGLIGAVFMALTFTITSFSCTGPFLGLLAAGYAGAGAQNIALVHLVVGAMTYATVFALPFFLLAMFPALLKTLPKSGGWLNTIKVSMGFVELGAALKFLSVTDANWFPGDPMLFTYDTVLIAWVVLSGLCGLYLIGLFSLPNDDVQDRVGVIRMLFGSIFLGLSVLMIPMLFGRTPAGIVGSTVEAILPQNFKPFNTGNGGSTESHAEWTKDYEAARNQALQEGKPLFLDFTGQNCPNCRLNEKKVFSKPHVRKRLDQFVGVQLYTDTVPKLGYTPGEAKEEANRNTRWQVKLASAALPSYVIFRPDPKEAFTEDGYPKGEIIIPDGKRYVSGTINDIGEFNEWLDKGLEIGRAKMNQAQKGTLAKKDNAPKQTAQAKS
ncbi:MAG: protein-disulfide reductase DsbD family protein [Gemmataceae bacterium]